MTFKIDIAYEEQVLARSMRDTNYLKRAARVLDEHHFGTKQHSWLWKTVRSTWDRHRERASAELILSSAKRDFPDDDKRQPYLELASKLIKTKPSKSSSALEELSLFVRTVNAQIALEKQATLLEKGKIDELYECMRQVSKRDFKPREYTQVKWIEEFEKRQEERKHRREHPELYTSIPTGLGRLDKVIGGLQLGELGLIMGTTGRGKSVMLTNIAYHAIRCGWPTAIFGFEMPARQIAQRQDARWLQIPYLKFKEYDFTPSELKYIKMRLRKMRPKFADKLQIFSMPVRSADINSIRNTLEDAKHEDGFAPKLIILDSADHLNPLENMKDMRLNQASVYWECKGLAEEDGYAIWSSTQAGKEYATKTATAEATSESYDKARIADLILSLNEPKRETRATKISDEDESEGEESSETPITIGRYMEAFLAKYRDGASKITIPLDAALEKMMISEAGVDEEEKAA